MNAIHNITVDKINQLPVKVKELPNNSHNHNGYHAFMILLSSAFWNVLEPVREAVIAPLREMGAHDDNDSNNNKKKADDLHLPFLEGHQLNRLDIEEHKENIK